MTHLSIERAASSQGTIVIVHGLGEHSARYAHVVRSLHQAGWTVVTYDQWGHGRAAGKRGAIPSANALLENLAYVIDEAVRATQPARLVLLGHSMGGAIAARFAGEVLRERPADWSRTVDGLILSSPALSIFLKTSDRIAVRILSRLAPNLPRRNGLDAEKISHDASIVEAYRTDPLVHDRVTPRLVQAILDAGAFVRSHATQWQVPTLLLYAGDDHLVDARGSVSFGMAAPPAAVETEAFPSLYHEILNEAEPARGEVFARVHDWLRRFASART